MRVLFAPFQRLPDHLVLIRAGEMPQKSLASPLKENGRRGLRETMAAFLDRLKGNSRVADTLTKAVLIQSYACQGTDLVGIANHAV